MATRKRPERVAFIPPNTHPDVSAGHYRSIDDENDPHGGELVVWIDEAPGNDDDGSGHFEYYNGDASEYTSAPVTPPATGETKGLSGETTGSGGTGVGS